MRRHRSFMAVIAASAAGLLAAGCGSNSGTSNAGAGKPLIISDVTGANWNCQFNPLSTNWPEGGPSETGVIYDRLMFVNALQTGSHASQAMRAWLASSCSWNSELTANSFSTRNGVP